MTRDMVIDASVGIKLFVDEPDSPLADRLFAQLAASPAARFYVPDLFFVECANILWKYTRRFDYPADNARRDVTALGQLNLRAVSTADLMEAGLELALALDITVYDAAYAALAQLLAVPLVTADDRLRRKLQGATGINVATLADVSGN